MSRPEWVTFTHFLIGRKCTPSPTTRTLSPSSRCLLEVFQTGTLLCGSTSCGTVRRQPISGTSATLFPRHQRTLIPLSFSLLLSAMNLLRTLRMSSHLSSFTLVHNLGLVC